MSPVKLLFKHTLEYLMEVAVDVIPLVDEGPGHSAHVVDPGEAFDRAVADDAEVVDLRQTSESTAGHVPGTAHVELGALAAGPDGVPATSLLVHCGHGERAMSAASLRHRAGHDDVAVLAGGPDELGALETGTGA